MSTGDAPPTRTERAAGEAVLSALAGAARREAHGEAPPGADARGRARVLDGLRARRAGPRRGIVWSAAAATLVAVVASLLLLSPRAPLRFTIDGKAAVAGAYVHASPAPAPGAHGDSLPSPRSTVRFSDGSEIGFTAGAAGRVTEVGPHGARILLEAGTGAFSIVHAPGARWSVEAGPFAIAVIGTAFDATWSAETQTLAVRLRAGEVSVVGPLAPAGVHVRAGQELTARVVEGDLRIGEAAPEALPPPTAIGAPRDAPAESALTAPLLAPPVATTTVASPPSAAPPVSAVATGAAGAAPVGAALPSWPKRVAAGDFRGVLDDAEARGLDAALHGVSLPDLVALADAARYAGRPDLARRALLAERARFAGSAEAHGAAFLLGRLADDGGSTAAAIRWYDDYLTEAPRGAFAAEAFGRKLVALRRAGDPTTGATATEYLRRYPDGAYASVARELLSNP